MRTLSKGINGLLNQWLHLSRLLPYFCWYKTGPLNLPFFIARRYLISKKSHNIINLISGISMVGVAVGTAALIIVLSVFNGFESVVISLFSVFDPDIEITVAQGKTFHNSEINADKIRALPGVIHYTEVVEENALLHYKKQQFLATIKGVDSLYQKNSPIDSLLVTGEMVLQTDSLDYAIPGYGIAYFLGLDMNAPDNLISVYIPKRKGAISGLPQESFKSELIRPTAIFSVQQDFDDKYMLVPLRFARRMLDYTDEVTSIEIRFAKGSDEGVIKEEIKEITGPGFRVQSRYEQQEVLYSIMKSEKWAVFMILTFILLVASFNVIGSLTMLILDKQKDINIMRSLGARDNTIKQIFFFEGLLITLTGAVAGLLLGLLVCFVQLKFGLIKLQGGGSFIISAYPVKIILTDFVYVFITIALIGTAAAWLPVRRIKVILKKPV
jgi:lipoprotein-releasing system permease protein